MTQKLRQMYNEEHRRHYFISIIICANCHASDRATTYMSLVGVGLDEKRTRTTVQGGVLSFQSAYVSQAGVETLALACYPGQGVFDFVSSK